MVYRDDEAADTDGRSGERGASDEITRDGSVTEDGSATDRGHRADPSLPVTKRTFLAGSAATTAAGGLAGCTRRSRDAGPSDTAVESPATAAAEASQWTGDVDADGYALTNLGRLNDAVHVGEDETLDEALASVEGPAYVVLPAGVTEYEQPISRAATTVIRGRGDGASILRPADDGVQLVMQTEPYDGDLLFRGCTLDRANRAGRRVVEEDGQWVPANEHGPNVLTSSAGGRVAFDDVTMHHFDFAERPGTLLRCTNDPERVEFSDTTIDFKAGGGVTNRHRRGDEDGRVAVGLVTCGDVDRLLVDEGCLFRGNTVDRPPRSMPENWGSITGFDAHVHDYALVDGEFREWDYGAWLGGGPADPDAVVEFRCNDLDAGFADQFWPRCVVDGEGGHVIYDGVTITSAPNNIYNDRGMHSIVKPYHTGESFYSVTIRNCNIRGRGVPIQINGGGVHQVTISDTTIAARKAGILIESDHSPIGSVKIDNVHVRPHEDVDHFEQAIELKERGQPWGPLHVISNVLSVGHVRGPILDGTDEDTTVLQRHVDGQSFERDLPDASPVATVPRQALDVVADPAQVADLEPIATAEDFAGPTDPEEASIGGHNPDHLDELKVYLTWADEGLYFFAIVGDPSHEATEDPAILYQRDSVHVGISDGRPGAAPAWDEPELGLTPDGPVVWRRRYPSGQSGLMDVPVAIDRDDDAGRTIYCTHFPWERLEVRPPYDDISVDVAVNNNGGDPPNGLADWNNPYDNGEDNSGIFHGKDNRAYKWVELEGPAG